MSISSVGATGEYYGRTKETGSYTSRKAEDGAKQNAAAEEFLKLANMSPIERLRAAYLKDHNLTEETLAALPKEEQIKIEEEIRQFIKQKVKNGAETKGAFVDVRI